MGLNINKPREPEIKFKENFKGWIKSKSLELSIQDILIAFSALLIGIIELIRDNVSILFYVAFIILIIGDYFRFREKLNYQKEEWKIKNINPSINEKEE